MTDDLDKATKGFIDAAKRSGYGMFAEANAEEADWMLEMRDAINELFRAKRAEEAKE